MNSMGSNGGEKVDSSGGGDAMKAPWLPAVHSLIRAVQNNSTAPGRAGEQSSDYRSEMTGAFASRGMITGVGQLVTYVRRCGNSPLLRNGRRKDNRELVRWLIVPIHLMRLLLLPNYIRGNL